MATDLSQFPITRKWPPRDPSAIQLYSLPTPNGVKISIMLEECGLPYEAHKVSFDTRDQFSEEFLSLNPNNKIPAMIDPDGPGGKPIGLFESGAMLEYLADKTGKFLPHGAARYEALQWLYFQIGGVGPMFGQYGFFHVFAGKEIEDDRPRKRYADEAERLLGVMDRRMEGRDWIAGDYSIADIAICPWLRGAKVFYKMGQVIDWTQFPHVTAWLDRFLARPAVEKGLNIPPRS